MRKTLLLAALCAALAGPAAAAQPVTMKTVSLWAEIGPETTACPFFRSPDECITPVWDRIPAKVIAYQSDGMAQILIEGQDEVFLTSQDMVTVRLAGCRMRLDAYARGAVCRAGK